MKPANIKPLIASQQNLAKPLARVFDEIDKVRAEGGFDFEFKGFPASLTDRYLEIIRKFGKDFLKE